MKKFILLILMAIHIPYSAANERKPISTITSQDRMFGTYTCYSYAFTGIRDEKAYIYSRTKFTVGVKKELIKVHVQGKYLTSINEPNQQHSWFDEYYLNSSSGLHSMSIEDQSKNGGNRILLRYSYDQMYNRYAVEAYCSRA